jgi:hypothetical protein
MHNPIHPLEKKSCMKYGEEHTVTGLNRNCKDWRRTRAALLPVSLRERDHNTAPRAVWAPADVPLALSSSSRDFSPPDAAHKRPSVGQTLHTRGRALARRCTQATQRWPNAGHRRLSVGQTLHTCGSTLARRCTNAAERWPDAAHMRLSVGQIHLGTKLWYMSKNFVRGTEHEVDCGEVSATTAAK